MDVKNELILTKNLKTNIWSDLAKKHSEPKISYDKDEDTLTLLFLPCKERVLVHYVNYYMALLYRYSDKEIVGIQIDSVTKGLR
jgi:hypothetical protein